MSDAARSEEDRSLTGVRIALAGRLSGMSHREAGRLIRAHGGFLQDNPDAGVDLIVVGDQLAAAGPTSPQRSRLLSIAGEQVRAAIEQGRVPIIAETELWRRLGLVDSEPDIQRLYTPAMLADLLRIEVAFIRRWQRRGLIQPVRRVRRLPYFDYSQVLVARQLAAMLSAGASPATLEQRWLEWNRQLDSGEPPHGQFTVVADGRYILRRQRGQLREAGGQCWFPFVDQPRPSDIGTSALTFDSALCEPANVLPLADVASGTDSPGPDMLVAMAEQMEDQGELSAAADLYRAALAAGGANADFCFALAELFYRMGDLSAARERYFMAIELDQDFVEARANLGCLLAEQGQPQMAIAALEGALRYHPDYADAHYHLARTLHELHRREEAIPHWQAFLRLAPDSPWAAEVRLLLELSGQLPL